MRWMVLTATLLLPRPASATWPVDGVPVGVAPTGKVIYSAVADGEDAVFVTWLEYTAAPSRVRVQRLRADGSLAPGWPPEGVLPAFSNRRQERPDVVPDGLGGCYVAWWDEYDNWYDGAIYLQHILPSGVQDPAWPTAGVIVASGYFYPSGIGSTVSFLGLEPNPGGGSIVLMLANPFGCHDGFCGSGGYASLVRMSAAGTYVSSLLIEGCQPQSPRFHAISDGADGVFALIVSPCLPASGSGFRHVRLGTEPVALLPSYTEPDASQLRLAEDGTVLAVRATYPSGYGQVPVVQHWNPDGTAASGAPPGGRPFASAPQWSLAADPAGSSCFVWRPIDAPTTLRSVKLGPDLSTAPGWDPSGNPWVTTPAIVDRFATVSDGNGGAYVVWIDPRKGTSDFDVFASHLASDGRIVPAPSTGGLPLCMAPGSQAAPHVVRLGSELAIAVWQDSRSGVGVDIYAQRLAIDVPVPVLISLSRIDAAPGLALVEWQLGQDVSEVVVERTRDGDSWSTCAHVAPGSLRRVRYEDTDVRPREVWGYRIAIDDAGALVHSDVAWVTIPSDRLGVRQIGPASASRLEVEVTLLSVGAARLELVDLAGRRLLAVDLDRLSAGAHRVELAIGDIPSGVAWLALRQQGASRVIRVPILR